MPALHNTGSCPTTNGSPRARRILPKKRSSPAPRDELSRKRRELPWEKVEKNYVFDGPTASETLADLFGGKAS